MIVRDELHREILEVELVIEAFVQDGERIALLRPRALPVAHRVERELRLLCESEVELVAKLYQSHGASEIEVERLIVAIDAVERHARFEMRLSLLCNVVCRHGRCELV